MTKNPADGDVVFNVGGQAVIVGDASDDVQRGVGKRDVLTSHLSPATSAPQNCRQTPAAQGQGRQQAQGIASAGGVCEEQDEETDK
jgi:hypothetical protein